MSCRKLKQEDDEENVCSICYLSTNFRVLKCGHSFCFKCLTTFYRHHKGKIICPMDRDVDLREPSALPTPEKFRGKIFNINVEEKVPPNFERLFAGLVKHRKITIKQLRDIAELLNSHEFKCAISKVAGAVTGVSNINIRSQ